MPKMKTHSGAKKRFKRSAKGKWIRSHANKDHLNTKKSSNRKRRLRQTGIVAEVDSKRIKLLLPYA